MVEPDAGELGAPQELSSVSTSSRSRMRNRFIFGPELEQYDEAKILFGVLRTAAYVDDREEVDFGEVSVFWSQRFVITFVGGRPGFLCARPAPARRRSALRSALAAVVGG